MPLFLKMVCVLEFSSPIREHWLLPFCLETNLKWIISSEVYLHCTHQRILHIQDYLVFSEKLNKCNL